MDDVEREILATLQEIKRAVDSMSTAPVKPNLIPLFERLERLRKTLPSSSDPPAPPLFGASKLRKSSDAPRIASCLMFEDTICAVATPLGEGGLAVIRISGPKALQIADRLYVGRRKPSETAANTAVYGRVVQNGNVIDEAIFTIFRGPRSFTGEDVVEVSCHGGVLVAKTVLDAVLAGGSRLAHPGEFTRRAFLNGRIDLTQAEAVADLIGSRTDLALRAANEQLAGRLAQKINLVRDDLMLVLAHVEAHIDFPDEDIAPDTRDKLISKLEVAGESMKTLLRTAPEGQILRRGISMAIVGRPNAGKSSLLNQLLGRDRAIVSPIPGTTRDTIEETANIRGIPVRFIDTAGLRESSDQIEQEGIRRSRQSIDAADVVIVVIDQSEPLAPEDEAVLTATAERKRLVVMNKADLPNVARAEGIRVSSRLGTGIEELKDHIKGLVWQGGVGGEMQEVMINARHEEALSRALRQVELTREALSRGDSIELAAMDLRLAVNAVGEIVGKTTTEDLLDAIFSQFCLGK